MPSAWLISWSFAAWTILSALAIYVLLIAFSRIIGPRPFSRMTAFDFAVTVALGAVVGSTAAGAVGLPAALLALASLFTFRGLVALLRRHGLSRWVDNSPLMSFRNGYFHEANLRRAELTLDDVYEALRLRGATRLDDVAAVIMERNGALSVLPQTGRQTVNCCATSSRTTRRRHSRRSLPRKRLGVGWWHHRRANVRPGGGR